MPWNEELQFFEVDFQQDPTITFLNFHTSIFFEKLAFPTMSKTAILGQKNTRNFRG
jgi:hypothetical protein